MKLIIINGAFGQNLTKLKTYSYSFCWNPGIDVYHFILSTSESTKNLNEDWAKTDQVIMEGFKQSWMPGGFFVDGHGNEVEYNLQTRRAWHRMKISIRGSTVKVNGSVWRSDGQFVCILAYYLIE